MDKIKVFIVDDSATVRRVITTILDADPDISVIGSAANPVFALRKMELEWPDVIVSDIEMPEMDGITFLKKVIAERPTPFVICSTQAEKAAKGVLNALSQGAFEIVQKPEVGISGFLNEQAQTFVELVKCASKSRLGCRRVSDRAPDTQENRISAKKTTMINASEINRSGLSNTEKIIAIGSSTGGTTVLEELLKDLSPQLPPIVIVQHMPANFTNAFANRLNEVSPLQISEAKDGDVLKPGHVYLAPGGMHVEVRRSGLNNKILVNDGPPISRHKPSATVLFRSVSKLYRKHALGIVLTGMGDDGARGLLMMKESGALTAVQDEESCVVYGMPKVAMQLGAAKYSLGISEIADLIRRYG